MIKPSALALLLLVTATQSQDWRQADPNYAWSYPRDHWSHDAFRTEWWYFTGHVRTTSEPVRDFGYQFTVFRIGLHAERPPSQSGWSARDMLMGHAAITDVTGQTHHFSEILYRAAPILAGFHAYPDSRIAHAAGPAGTDDEWTLDWTGQGFRFAMADHAQGLRLAITMEPSKPVVWQGPNGFSPKKADESAASMYYSIPRLATAGTITIGADSFDVRGVSWMDREFGSSQLGVDQVGWDWFGLQLDDGRDLMVYRLRGSDEQSHYGYATLIDPAGRPTYLPSTAWHLRQIGTWRSTATNTTYPSAWQITVPQLQLQLLVRPLVANQENVSRLISDLAYWEGAVRVADATGREIGRGYVELTGYGRTRRPAI